MPTSALGEEATFEELFGLNLFEKGGNKLRLGMYSNADGDKSSWAAEFKFDKSFTLGSPNYPNADKDEFAPAVEGPAFTPEELIAIAAYFGESDRSFRFYPITFSSSFSSLPVLP